MKFLNYDRVLCLSPHPDDVEYGMLGTILKYKDTQFDIIVLSQGGDFDKSLPRTETKTGEKHTDFDVEPNPNLSPEY